MISNEFPLVEILSHSMDQSETRFDNENKAHFDIEAFLSKMPFSPFEILPKFSRRLIGRIQVMANQKKDQV